MDMSSSLDLADSHLLRSFVTTSPVAQLLGESQVHNIIHQLKHKQSSSMLFGVVGVCICLPFPSNQKRL